MRRTAKIAGWTVFALSAVGLGTITLGLLAIRSPLADGSFAPGPERTAYVLGLAIVLFGAMVAGTVVAWLVELLARALRP